MINVATFGCGVDSTAGLLLAQEQGIKYDEILFSDTGGEMPETYAYMDYFEKKSSRYNLVPGVEVVSSIHTGERSVLEYIFEPFLTSIDSALQER